MVARAPVMDARVDDDLWPHSLWRGRMRRIRLSTATRATINTTKKKPRAAAVVVGATVSLLALSGTAFGQAPQAVAQVVVVDPGPRGGAPGAGGSVTALSTLDQNFFTAAQLRFQEVDSVSGTVSGETGSGLGPVFNGNSCAMCHIFPALGGSSPPLNPQVALATLDSAVASNTVPSFITSNGPIREARFILNSSGAPDGGVHDLYTIAGRMDAPGCNLSQPNFNQAIDQGNIIFRIPTPLFGVGLVENVPDANLISQEASLQTLQAALGITSGVFNISGNDGTITRFGWKAQNKSALMFAGEAYNVEQGVTNELFPDERNTTSGCVFNATPEDSTNMTDSGPGLSPASDFSSDIVNFAAFMRLLAQPTAAASTSQTTNGAQQFDNIGCTRCHIPRQRTVNSVFGPGMSQQELHVYSDFALHNMGVGLQDQISQGAANGQQFRTAPLWGLGQRLFFLHDGRESNLLSVIADHQSSGSEANQTVTNFNGLSPTNQLDIILFLRSL
ncbi:di-heme oxidoredictase family protein [Bradyrhizobium sp.]|uniref:di-heme oxidoredictase family protein n=1 Tax=Bradyrhizobium sp. TaxID=376 RepID=UPI003C182CB1